MTCLEPALHGMPRWPHNLLLRLHLPAVLGLTPPEHVCVVLVLVPVLAQHSGCAGHT